MAKHVTTEERERIVAAFAEGKSCNQIAREFGRSQSTISGIAADIGHDFERSATKKAAESKRSYNQAERLAFVNEVLDKGKELLGTVEKPSQYRDLTIGIGTMLDKRRLEDTGTAARGQLDAIYEHITSTAAKYVADSLPETGVDDRASDGTD